MNLNIKENSDAIDEAIKASTIATDFTNEILAQEGECSDEFKYFMRSSQRDILHEKLQKDIDCKSRILDEILTHDLIAKELQFRTMLEAKGRRKYTIKRVVTSACAVAAALVAVSFIVFNNNSNKYQNVIVNVSPQKSDVSIPTIITAEQQVIGLGDDIENIEAKMSYVSMDERVVNYDVKENSSTKSVKLNKLIVPALFTQKLILQDGTEVMVNSCSELEYPVMFNGATREVTLHGEAYFKVAKSDKPFIVKINESYIKVLGTEFNINARESDLIKTVLIEGSVAVAFNNKTVTMKPNEIAVIDKNNNNIKVEPTDVHRHIAWMDGYSEFINEDFSSVINELSNWYGVEFSYDITDFKDTKLNLSMEKSLTLVETFSKLKMAINLSINLNKDGKYEIKRVKK